MKYLNELAACCRGLKTQIPCVKLQTVRLTPTSTDSCLYVDKDKLTFILVYVDDILIFSSDKQKEAKIKKTLERSFTIKDLGEALFGLRDTTRGRVHISF